MPIDDAMLREVRKAVEQGDRARAKDLLTRALRRDQDDPTVWLWMSAVVDTPKERIYCLREVLRLDPNNIAARRGLNMMGELPPEPLPAEPQRLKRRNWQAEMTRAERPPVKVPWKNIIIYGGTGLVALGLVLFAIFGPNARKKNTGPTGPVSYRPFPTMTYTVTVTPTMTPTPSEPTPPWQALAATYTPTPLYVNTPHPIIEAYGLAIRAYQRAEWAKAVEYLKQSIQSEPNAPDLFYLLGEVYRLTGSYGDAAAAYEQALQLNSSFAPAYLGRALNTWVEDASKVDAIKADLETALQLDRGLPETLTQLGLLDLSNDQADAAVSRFNEAESLNLAFPITYYYRARAYLSLDNPTAALADAERASQSDVTMLPAYLALADAIQGSGRLTDSIVPLEIYLRYTQNPDPSTYFKIGKAYRSAGLFDAALDSLNRLLAEVPESVAGLVERGLVYLDLDDPAKAQVDFETALKLAPESFDAGIGRSQALIELGAMSDAVTQLNQMQMDDLNEIQQLTIYYFRAAALEPLDPLAAIIDWERVAAAPEGTVPAEWVAIANERLAALYTPTPTLEQPGQTPTPAPT